MVHGSAEALGIAPLTSRLIKMSQNLHLGISSGAWYADVPVGGALAALTGLVFPFGEGGEAGLAIRDEEEAFEWVEAGLETGLEAVSPGGWLSVGVGDVMVDMRRGDATRSIWESVRNVRSSHSAEGLSHGATTLDLRSSLQFTRRYGVCVCVSGVC